MIGTSFTLQPVKFSKFENLISELIKLKLARKHMSENILKGFMDVGSGDSDGQAFSRNFAVTVIRIDLYKV